jgi:putative ABC transport system permease protein
MAARNLGRRRVRSVLTISGIVVGVTLIVALASISESLNSAVDMAASQMSVEQAAGLGEVSKSVNMFLAGIGGVAFLIAGLGIMNTMMISVAERKREIGIMKAIGAGKRRIMRVFLIESAVQGMIGGAAGSLLGYGLTKTVGLLLSISRNVDIDIGVSFRSIALAFLVALISALLWGAYPSWRASSLKPVEALRNE